MIYAAADELLGDGDVVGGVVGGGVVVGGVVGGGVVGGGVVGGGVRVCVGVGELRCDGAGVGEGADAVWLLCAGDVVGVLFAGPGTAVGLLVALPPVPLLWPGAELVADDAGRLVVEPALDPPVLCGFAPVRPADWLGAGVLPALGVVPGDAAE